MVNYYDSTSYGLRARIKMFLMLQRWAWVALFGHRKINIKLAVKVGEH